MIVAGMVLQRRLPRLAALLCLPLLISTACTGEREKNPPSPEVVAPPSHRDLRAYLAAHDYNWESITAGAGVPPFILGTLPDDLHRIQYTEEKKKLFFLSLLPMVLLANEEIDGQRKLLERLLADHQAGKTLNPEARKWAIDLAAEYRLEGDPLENSRLQRLLLQRLDIIPPPLALAQAATESGFGTSRLARTGNNLFGEFSLTDREDGQRYRLRTFPSLYDSVQSYMKNLNTHPAYVDFRTRRAHLRSQGILPAGSELAQELTAYSERGQAYTQDITTMIRQNRLSLLASANLRSRVVQGVSADAALPSPPGDRPPSR